MPRRLLIVDDRPELRAYVVDAIGAARTDLEVVEAANGEQALARLAESTIDLVITDLDMPVMNGVELVRRLRAAEDPPPVVLISGAPPEGAAGAAAAELADLPLLRKPLRLRELLRVVGVHLPA